MLAMPSGIPQICIAGRVRVLRCGRYILANGVVFTSQMVFEDLTFGMIRAEDEVLGGTIRNSATRARALPCPHEPNA
jgi:hypothetical protein